MKFDTSIKVVICFKPVNKTKITIYRLILIFNYIVKNSSVYLSFRLLKTCALEKTVFFLLQTLVLSVDRNQILGISR